MRANRTPLPASNSRRRLTTVFLTSCRAQRDGSLMFPMTRKPGTAAGAGGRFAGARCSAFPQPTTKSAKTTAETPSNANLGITACTRSGMRPAMAASHAYPLGAGLVLGLASVGAGSVDSLVGLSRPSERRG